MEYSYQFNDDANKQTIIGNNTDKFLILEKRHIEGNFLVFSDVRPLEVQLNDLNNTTNMILLKQEGII